MASHRDGRAPPRVTRFAYAGWATLAVAPALRSSGPDDVLEDAVERALERLGEAGAEDSGFGVLLQRLLGAIESLEIESEPEFRAPAGIIEEWEEEAAEGPLPPVVSLRSFWLVRSPHLPADALASRLVLLHPVIREAWQVTPLVPAAVQPSDDLEAGTQRHLFPAPEGIDARYAWAASNCDGSGVGFADVERGWNPHSDLPAFYERFPLSWTPTTARWHGTAVLGVVCALDDAKLVIGVAPECHPPLVYAADSNPRVARALERVLLDLDAATGPANGLSPFDVVLIEVQDINLRIAEYHSDIRAAIRTCVNRSVIVVECAGNGNHDLDTLLPGGGVGTWDSGAIVVAASDPDTGHARWYDSSTQGTNHGSRADCFAPGVGVVTTDGSDPSGVQTDFGGTSAAGAIIAGAAVLVQHMAETALGHRLGPAALRTLLRDPALGTPSATGADIGVMPDLRKGWNIGLLQGPSLFIRDEVGDTGIEPSGASPAASPDIRVVLQGTAPPWPPDAVAPAVVEAGKDHDVHVRVQNLVGGAPTGVSATVYWSPPATLVHPGMWRAIGTTTRPGPLAAAAGRVVLPPLPWAEADLPGGGHYCFVAIVDHPDDPAPAVPDFATVALQTGADPVALWHEFFRGHRNVSWRNFNVVVPPMGGGRVGTFLVSALPDRSREYRIVVIAEGLPEGVEVEVGLPASLEGRWVGLPADPLPRRRPRDDATVWVPTGRDEEAVRVRFGREGGRLGRFRLEPEARHLCHIGVVGWPEGDDPEGPAAEVAVVQLLGSAEVGRITWRLGDSSRIVARE